MTKIDVAGLKINSITKKELLNEINERIESNKKTFIITPYSEFLYRGLLDQTILRLLNKSDIAVPDGIGIFWAYKFLSLPLTFKSYFGKLIQCLWQVKYTLVAIIFNSKYIKSAFAEKISGSDLVWDLAKLAADHGKSIFILGGFDNTPKLTAQKIQKLYSCKIAGWSNKNPNDPSIIEEIKKSGADFLLVAFGPITQEKWILDNKDKLPCQLFIGLGGTFDYIAGKHKSPPSFIRTIGLEWLWRLLTQPYRIKRIWQATFGLITELIKHKIRMTLPYRRNVVCVVVNKEGKVFVGLRKPDGVSRNNNHWMFPQGGLENNETVEQGARREIYEEIGLQNLDFIKISPTVNTYIWEPGISKLFKGQAQNIAYFKFSGQDTEIDFLKYHTPEFIDYKWVDAKDLPKILHELRKPLDSIVQTDLLQI